MATTSTAFFEQKKYRLYRAIRQQLELGDLAGLPMETARERALLQIRDAIKEVRANSELQELARDIIEEILALGPLDELLRDPTVSDSLVNGCYEVYIDRHGHVQKTPAFKRLP